MSPEAQRIAIAEACGWTSLKWIDLNAMHEAEKHLLKVKAPQYIQCLSALVCGEYDESVHQFRYVTATAAQRAEAFLRTIGKWDDAK